MLWKWTWEKLAGAVEISPAPQAHSVCGITSRSTCSFTHCTFKREFQNKLIYEKQSFQFRKRGKCRKERLVIQRDSADCSSELLSSEFHAVQVFVGGHNVVLCKHYEGKTRATVSLASRLNLSGNFTSNSTIKSPRRSELFGKGRPSPVMRRFIPGRMMTSWSGRDTVRLSNVGAFTVQPQRA